MVVVLSGPWSLKKQATLLLDNSQCMASVGNWRQLSFLYPQDSAIVGSRERWIEMHLKNTRCPLFSSLEVWLQFEFGRFPSPHISLEDNSLFYGKVDFFKLGLEIGT